jgi:hypothetical protein
MGVTRSPITWSISSRMAETLGDYPMKEVEKRADHLIGVRSNAQ